MSLGRLSEVIWWGSTSRSRPSSTKFWRRAEGPDSGSSVSTLIQRLQMPRTILLPTTPNELRFYLQALRTLREQGLLSWSDRQSIDYLIRKLEQIERAL